MGIIDRLPRSAAFVTVIAGAGLLGTAVGGLAGVDADLRAASEARVVSSQPAAVRTSFDGRGAARSPSLADGRNDCPDPPFAEGREDLWLDEHELGPTSPPEV